MHGNAKKGLDDSLPFQAVVGIFLQIYYRGGGGGGVKYKKNILFL
jgi:hypothetical protein